MPSTYTDILGLELQETGENLNSWGLRLNQALRLVDDSQSFEVIPLSGNLSLSNTMNQPNQARKAALAFTDNNLAAAPTVTLPPIKRLRYVENRGATYAITFTAGGVAGVLPPGRKALVLCNGTDVSVVDWVAATANERAAAEAAKLLAQQWATFTGGLVDSQDYSAKEYASGLTPPTGSAKSWSVKTGSAVGGGEYSSKEYASGDLTATGGSAKAWAVDAVSPDGTTNKSAKSYAADAAGSAGSALQSVSDAAAQAQLSANQVGLAANQATAAQAQADRAAAAVSQIINDLGSDPLSASPVPPSKDVAFSEGFIPRTLSVTRNSTGSRVNRFGVTESTPLNALRHQYAVGGRYLGIGVDSDDDIRLPVSSDWLSQSESTLFFEATTAIGAAQQQYLFTLSDGTSSNFWGVLRLSADPKRFAMQATIGGNSLYNAQYSSLPAPADGSLVRVAVSTNRSVSRIAVNGSAVEQSHTASRVLDLSAMSQFRVGSANAATTTRWQGYIKNVAAIPRFLSLSDLQNLTRLAA